MTVPRARLEQHITTMKEYIVEKLSRPVSFENSAEMSSAVHPTNASGVHVPRSDRRSFQSFQANDLTGRLFFNVEWESRA
jgi:hypothetical protein